MVINEHIEQRPPKIVVIGGGTGTSTILCELKFLTPDLTAVVNMSDDGGSSGELVRELGVMPGGDLRQCQVALSNYPALAEEFERRNQDGHALGNLVLAQLELGLGDIQTSVDHVNHMLKITGEVLPVTTSRHDLVMQYGKTIVRGESLIGHYILPPNTRPTISMDPSVTLNPRAETALHEADLVAIACGNTNGSVLPALVVKGIKETLRDTKAKTVMVANLLNKPGQTDDWHVQDYVQHIERHIGGDQIDMTLFNTDLPTQAMIAKHGSKGEAPVRVDEDEFEDCFATPIGAALLSSTVRTNAVNDVLFKHKRTVIKHDSARVASKLAHIAQHIVANSDVYDNSRMR